MRFKYYLRGIGIGITLATLLLTISFYFGRDALVSKELSDEEIIKLASDLGMVMPEEETADTSAEDEDKAGQKASEEETEAAPETQTETEEKPDVVTDNSNDFNQQEKKEIKEITDDQIEEIEKIQEKSESIEKDTNKLDVTKGDEETKVTYVPFTIRGGQSSEIISSNLQKAGLIDSSDKFNKYLNKLNVDDKIKAGTFYVKEGSTYDDVIALLVNKEVRTTTPPKN